MTLLSSIFSRQLPPCQQVSSISSSPLPLCHQVSSISSRHLPLSQQVSSISSSPLPLSQQVSSISSRHLPLSQQVSSISSRHFPLYQQTHQEQTVPLFLRHIITKQELGNASCFNFNESEENTYSGLNVHGPIISSDIRSIHIWHCHTESCTRLHLLSSVTIPFYVHFTHPRSG
jgi:hypothetical protein